MLNIYSKDISNILSGVKGDIIPKWGNMNLVEMLDHLSYVMEVSTGKYEVEILTPPERIPSFQKYLMSEKPMPRNFEAPFKVQSHEPPSKNFQEAIHRMLNTLQKFHSYYMQNPGAVHKHPTFGELNHDQWTQLHNKHFTHHFMQFGLIEEPVVNQP